MAGIRTPRPLEPPGGGRRPTGPGRTEDRLGRWRPAGAKKRAGRASASLTAALARGAGRTRRQRGGADGVQAAGRAAARPAPRTPGATTLEEVMPDAYGELARIRSVLETALPRHAGHRVHDRGRRALDAPDAHGQAQRHRRGAHGGRDGGRGADRPGGGDPARAAPSSSTSCSTGGSIPRPRRAPSRSRGACPQARAAARGVIATTAERAEALAKKGKTVVLVRNETSPEDDQRHARRRGDPDGQGRHDEPRRARRARVGEVLRRRLRATLEVDERQRHRPRGRAHLQGRRHDHRERDAGSRLRGERCPCCRPTRRAMPGTAS